MQNKRNHRGFTMAELLIVVAIITVLAGVSFIAVQAHQKSMANLEAIAIAKEIFIAAQNHLTQAESQGYLGDSVAYGNVEDAEKGIYYFKVPGDSFSGSVLGLMLPFGSIDETIRTPGNYVVRYQANPALVLDVFYGARTGRYKSDPTKIELTSLLAKTENERKDEVIGWYGGAGTQQTGAELNAPVITVQNAERLTVTVDVSKVNVDSSKTGADTSIIGSADLSLQLIITNADETAMAAIPLSVNAASSTGGSLPQSHPRVTNPTDGGGLTDKNVFVITLDDVTTANMHFADINSDSSIDRVGIFKPGEDIIVYAVAYSNTVLCNIMNSNAVTTNSLFADLEAKAGGTSGSGLEDEDGGTEGSTASTALIGNFRHLENLDAAVSKLSTDTGIDSAKQIEDLNWQGFIQSIKDAKGNDEAVKVYDASATPGADNCFLPLSPDYALTYEGGYTETDAVTLTTAQKNHSITGVVIAGSIDSTNWTPLTPYVGPAGLFGEPKDKLTVRDLALVDFNISASGSAGALVGALSADLTVDNVVAYNSGNSAEITIRSTAASAGGLIGGVTGSGTTTVIHSAAALVVSSTGGDAGGLIGTATGGGEITGCYAGGHTEKGMFLKDDDAKTPIYNITATGNAGGLIGNAGTVSIKNSYATCSVQGATAGGLAGTASNVNNSYAAGMVAGTSDTAKTGALVGNLTGQAQNCSYFEAVNPGLTMANGGTVSNDPSLPPEIDADYATYRAFVAGPHVEAKPYDAQLSGIYTDAADGKVKFNLKDIAQLGETLGTDKEYFVATHYGDWPVPGIQVQNTEAGTP